MKMKSWIRAARPRTLPLAISCVLFGGALARSSELSLDGLNRFGPVSICALTTVLLLQILANFANDYGDFASGTDARAERTDRALTSGSLTATSMKKAIRTTAVAALAMGILTLILAFVPGIVPGTENAMLEYSMMGLWGVFGVLGIFAALGYTMGKNPNGYRGFGDLFVLLFFGIVGVLGVGSLVAHKVDLSWILVALFSGCMSVAVLNLNNLRDHETDAQSGKRTLVVKLGFQGGKRYHLVILLIGWASLGAFFLGPWSAGDWRGGYWYALIALLHFRHAFDVWKCKQPADLDPELKRIALSTFLVALFMFMEQTVSIG